MLQWCMYSMRVFCLCCGYSPIRVKPWLVSAYQWEGLITRLTVYEDWYAHSVRTDMWGLISQSRVDTCRLLLPVWPCFGYASYCANPVMFWYGLKSGCVVSGFSCEGPSCRPISLLSLTGTELPGSSYQAICDYLLLVLDLEVCGVALLWIEVGWY